MIFLVLGWLALYHGALLWLALRFKDKSWRWWWFGAVMTVGLGIAWFDQFYLRFIVEPKYCEANKEKLGFRQLTPLSLKQDQVVWLYPVSSAMNQPQVHPQIVRSVTQSDERNAFTTNAATCRKPDTGDKWICLVPKLKVEQTIDGIYFLGIRFATKLHRQMRINDEVIRQALVIYWPGSRFFGIFKIDVPVLTAGTGCGGKWEDVAMGPQWVVQIDE